MTYLDDQDLPSGKTNRVKWTFQVDRSAEDGLVFSWLLAQAGGRASKEMANEALKAFYLAFAHQEAHYDGAAARKIAKKSVWALLYQILHLSEEFELDLTPVIAVLSCSDQVKRSDGVTPSAPSDFNYPNQQQTAGVPNSIWDNLGYDDDDDEDVFAQLRRE